ncbi:MarR family transcriptional regulator [Streptomyces sp. NBC_01190]|uniref:MarR family transcriptional regulator n=1 Tax=Streptomyces sp. NBC_01190 TaxID=2903767 RepID=UPI003867EBC1
MLWVAAGKTSVAAVARSTGYSRQAVQRVADALVADELAQYSADVHDRRKQRLELTEAGAVILGQRTSTGRSRSTCAESCSPCARRSPSCSTMAAERS